MNGVTTFAYGFATVAVYLQVRFEFFAIIDVEWRLGVNVRKFHFDVHGDERGQLVAVEELHDIPFTVRRVYYIYDTLPGVRRGFHAHKQLEQVLVCVHGSCKVLLDDGATKETVLLDKPNEGLYISNAVWREMYDFSGDAVLLVLASNYYDESDYIRDYDIFLRYVKQEEED